jgi:hypothetical protein
VLLEKDGENQTGRVKNEDILHRGKRKETFNAQKEGRLTGQVTSCVGT